MVCPAVYLSRRGFSDNSKSTESCLLGDDRQSLSSGDVIRNCINIREHGYFLTEACLDVLRLFDHERIQNVLFYITIYSIA